MVSNAVQLICDGNKISNELTRERTGRTEKTKY